MLVLLTALMWSLPLVGFPYALAALALGRWADALAACAFYLAVGALVSRLNPPPPLAHVHRREARREGAHGVRRVVSAALERVRHKHMPHERGGNGKLRIRCLLDRPWSPLVFFVDGFGLAAVGSGFGAPLVCDGRWRS
jgi:hypothetical protein